MTGSRQPKVVLIGVGVLAAGVLIVGFLGRFLGNPPKVGYNFSLSGKVAGTDVEKGKVRDAAGPASALTSTSASLEPCSNCADLRHLLEKGDLLSIVRSLHNEEKRMLEDDAHVEHIVSLFKGPVAPAKRALLLVLLIPWRSEHNLGERLATDLKACLESPVEMLVASVLWHASSVTPEKLRMERPETDPEFRWVQRVQWLFDEGTAPALIDEVRASIGKRGAQGFEAFATRSDIEIVQDIETSNGLNAEAVDTLLRAKTRLLESRPQFWYDMAKLAADVPIMREALLDSLLYDFQEDRAREILSSVNGSFILGKATQAEAAKLTQCVWSVRNDSFCCAAVASLGRDTSPQSALSLRQIATSHPSESVRAAAYAQLKNIDKRK